jgi:hypothetical protein
MTDIDASVLVLAPGGRDAAVAAAILSEERIGSRACTTLPELVGALDAASCAVVTEEALLTSNRQVLADWIAQQPPWSDFPFILLTMRGAVPDHRLTEMLGSADLAPCLPPFITRVRSGSGPVGTGLQTRSG